MKIKRERQARLDGLLKYVWDNGINDIEFHSDNDSWVRIDDYGDLTKVYEVESTDLFTITEEVEITEDTILDLVDIYKDYGLPLEVAFCKNTSVKEILKLDKESKIDTKFIHIQNDDGSIGELIWSKERGLL